MIHHKLFSIIFITICHILVSTTVKGQDLYKQAWQTVDKYDLKKASELFLEDAEKNKNPDSFIALAYIEELQTRFDLAWDYYNKALSLLKNPDPYIIAAMASERVVDNMESKKGKFIELLEKLTRNTNDGLIKTFGCERLGTYYKDHAELDKAIELFSEMNAITRWSVIGPFENISASGFYTIYPPEKEFNKDVVYKGKENKPVQWFDISKVRHDCWVDFTHYFPDTNSVFYGNVFVHSNQKKKIQLRIGTSGSLRAFLNDQLVFESFDETNNGADTYIVETYLQEGWNRVLLKVGYSEINRCNFLLRITDEKGFALNDLELSTEPQSYHPANEEHRVEVKSTIENFFTEKIKNDPLNPVNYLLLGETYSLNDKSYLGETTYLKAIEIFPDNIIFLMHLFGRYMRDGKTIRANTVYDKIDKRKDDIPLHVLTKIGRELKTSNKEKFISLYNKYSELMVDNPSWIQYKIIYYAFKNLPLKVKEVVNEAYKSFPYEYSIVSLKLNLDYSADHNLNAAASTLEKYAAHVSSPYVLKDLAGLYLSTSQFKKWEKTYEEMISYDPSDPEYYSAMSGVYYSMQDYRSAIEKIKEAIEISPYNSTYYSRLGAYYQAVNEPSEAEESYNNALKYSATNYYARDMLRTIKGPETIENEIKDYDVQGLINSAPGKETYPGKDAVILFTDTRSKLFSGGASETTEETLAKIFTADGIDLFHDFTIYYNNSFQELTLDKAVVIKPDGSEIEAQTLDGQIVFNSLEVNDCVYYKYRIRDYYDGALNSQYWNDIDFSHYLPAEKLRYSIIAPASEKLYFHGNNMEDNPTYTKTSGDKKLYVWEKMNTPGIEYEYYMPPTEDVGSHLYVSTIDSWKKIGDWYYNLTRSKLRKHYEVENKVKELLAGKEDLPVKEKIKTIHDYIVQNISYVYVPFLQSSFIPRNASDVILNKMGDCKDVVTLFIAMLNEIDVKSDYVLIRTLEQGKKYNALPGNYFNHVIAVTYLDNKKQYYDLTAKNFQCGEIPPTDKNAFVLEVNAGNSQPFYLPGELFDASNVYRKTDVIFNKDNSATMDVVSIKTGEGAAAMRDLYKELTPELRLKSFSERLSEELSNFTVNAFNVKNLDFLTDTVNYTYNITFNNYVSKTGNFLLFKIPWNDCLRQNLALSYDKRNYPFYYNGYDEEQEDIRIVLPDGNAPLEMPENFSLSCSVADFEINYKYDNGVITATRVMRQKKILIMPEEYLSFKEFYNKVMEKESMQILLKNK